MLICVLSAEVKEPNVEYMSKISCIQHVLFNDNFLFLDF